MGTHFFKAPKAPSSNTNLEARAIGSAAGAGHAAGIGAQKDLSTALGLGKSKFKPQKTNGAYPPGPKV